VSPPADTSTASKVSVLSEYRATMAPSRQVETSKPGTTTTPSVRGRSRRASTAPQRTPKVKPMADAVSRDELKLHVEVLEAKAEARSAAIDGKLDRLADAVTNLSAKVGEYKDEVSKVSTTVRTENNTTRITIVITVIASAIGVLSLLWAMQGTMTTANGNVLSGVQTGMAVQEAKDSAVAAQQAATEKKVVKK
jgi:ribonuclease PH